MDGHDETHASRQIGLGLDHTLGLTFDDQVPLAREAAALGYASLWTPDGKGIDGLQMCLLRWFGSAQATPGGIQTGTGVTPVGYRNPVGLAAAAATVSKASGGRFVLGIGSRGLHRHSARQEIGLRTDSVLEIMTEYLTVLRQLLRGDVVSHHGTTLTLEEVAIDIQAPVVPVYLGALGPKMLHLAGSIADGVVLNWSTPDHVAWSRAQIEEGATAAGRDPTDIKVAGYVRVCIDTNEDTAKAAAVSGLLPYALGLAASDKERWSERRYGYRAHFDRLGFGDSLDELHEMRHNGASHKQIVDAFPERLLRALCYFGPPEGAAEEFAKLSGGLDVAIARIVAPDGEAARAAMRALAPGGS